MVRRLYLARTPIDEIFSVHGFSKWDMGVGMIEIIIVVQVMALLGGKGGLCSGVLGLRSIYIYIVDAADVAYQTEKEIWKYLSVCFRLQ
jgi:hypothetical protein